MPRALHEHLREALTYGLHEGKNAAVEQMALERGQVGGIRNRSAYLMGVLKKKVAEADKLRQEREKEHAAKRKRKDEAKDAGKDGKAAGKAGDGEAGGGKAKRSKMA